MARQPDFLEMIDEAAALVRHKFPQAQFAAADHNPCGHREGWRFIFNVPAKGPESPAPSPADSTAVILSQHEEFGAVEHYGAPCLDYRLIPLPISMHPGQAVSLAKGARQSEERPRVINLQWPRGKEVEEPLYILTYATSGVSVGVYSKQVRGLTRPDSPA
ncbi:MAG: hypothetical protein K0U98_25275 [Deltaproteobacteria bacterium]|nr:hypothetical protein [Deltaproteobacteria bacterium]